jgi:hypothetical protein
MVWIYDDPLKKKEKGLQKDIDSKLGSESEKVIKVLTLLNELYLKKFKSAESLQKHFYYDTKKTKPIFNDSQARILVGSVKGGGEPDTNYPVINEVIESTLERVKMMDPTPISSSISNVFGYIEYPLKSAEESSIGPFVDLGTGLFHSFSEVGVSLLSSVGSAMGGPVGMAVVLPFTVFIALVSSCLAVAQGDFGQAIVHLVNALPIVGQTVVKAMSKVEDINRRFQKKKDKLLQIPIVANIVNATIPNIGGKRFSTYRNNNKKWKKTRRNRSKTL